MTFTVRTPVSVLAAGLFALSAPVALAQVAPPPGQADQDHRAHHPDAKGGEKPGSPPSDQPSMGQPSMGQPSMGQPSMGKMGHGGMMMHGDDMKQMMSMMRDMMAMMSAHSGMMASHVEGRIAALKTELKITEAQAPQWQRFADALRGAAKSMEAMQGQMMKADAPAPLSARLARQEEMLSAHLASVKALKAAFDPLYASFGDEQKKVADGIRIGPMGMM
jgi:LTXXQ motif family protein